MKSRVVALDMDSQYVTLPLVGITTTRPGSDVDAEGDTNDPSGKGSEICFEGYGKVKTKDSGEGVGAEYGHTTA
jgi:hypothetical protein